MRAARVAGPGRICLVRTAVPTRCSHTAVPLTFAFYSPTLESRKEAAHMRPTFFDLARVFHRARVAFTSWLRLVLHSGKF